MSTSEAGDRLAVILTPAAATAGLVIDGVSIANAGRRRLVRVDVDLPEDVLGSVDLDSVAAASRAISAALDASPETTDVIGAGPYALEVGTAGVGRPLRQRRHWMRARTRLVTVSTTGGGSVTGRLQQVDDDGIQLDVAGATASMPWPDVVVGEVQVEFRRLEPAPGQAAADGDDLDDLDGSDDLDDGDDLDDLDGSDDLDEGDGSDDSDVDETDDRTDEGRG